MNYIVQNVNLEGNVVSNDSEIKNKTAFRISWIDIMKGYCMLFVMLHHLNTSTYSFPSLYSSFYAPFFLTAFFVSGGLTYSTKRGFWKYLLNKTIILLVPLFTLGLIAILSSQVISFNEQESAGSQIIDLFVQVGTEGHKLWFIAAMFVYCIVFYPIAKLLQNKPYCILLAVSGLLIINIVLQYCTPMGQLPWHIESLGHGLFWIGIGYFLKLKKNKIASLLSRKRQYLLLVFVVVLYAGLLCISILVLNTGYMAFGSADFYGFSILLNGAGVAFIMLISKLTPQFRFIQYIGRSTLFYFAFHGKVQSLLFWIFSKLSILEFLNEYAVITSIVITLIEAVILLIPSELFNLFLPFTVGKKYDKDRLKKIFGRRKNENSTCQ